jgi:hypothetical protein
MLSKLALIIQSLVLLYAVYSLFFDIQRLDKLTEPNRVKDKINFIHLDLFDIDFYLFQMDKDKFFGSILKCTLLNYTVLIYTEY